MLRYVFNVVFNPGYAITSAGALVYFVNVKLQAGFMSTDSYTT